MKLHRRRNLIVAGRIAALLLGGNLLPAQLFPLDPSKAVTQYTHQVWEGEHGLAGSVASIVQTHDGYLWIATQAGLARFDGLRFTVFDTGNTPELPNNFVISLAEDTDGSLWIGTLGGLVRLRDGKFTVPAGGRGLRNPQVWALLPRSRGGLWIGTDCGLLSLNHGALTGTSEDGPLANARIRSLFEDGEGNLWVGNAGRRSHPIRRGAIHSLHDGRRLTK